MPQPYPVIQPFKRTFDVPDVAKSDVVLIIRSREGTPLYKLQCHSKGYTGDPDFDYSGDFECRLSSKDKQDRYSTLLTEDPNQSRDWESRGRFFASDLRNGCAVVPQFGATREFKLRAMDLTLQITDPMFMGDGTMKSLKLTVTVLPAPSFDRPIAEAVPVPKMGVPSNCELQQHFLDPNVPNKVAK
jgi:hypothetical protein